MLKQNKIFSLRKKGETLCLILKNRCSFRAQNKTPTERSAGKNIESCKENEREELECVVPLRNESFDLMLILMLFK